MENWKLLELNGPVSMSSVSPRNSDIVLSIESVLVYWQFQTNQKIDLRCHPSPITNICFSLDGEYILSYSPGVLVLWHGSTLEFLDSIHLPSSPDPHESFLQFLNRHLIFCESTSNAYCFTLILIQNGKLRVERSSQIESQGQCIDFMAVQDLRNLLTLEPLTIKFWDGDSWELLRKFNLNVVASCFQYCEKLRVLVLLLQNNTVFVLNRQGENLFVLSKPALTFNTIAVDKSECFIGTCEGIILVLNLQKLRITKELSLSNFSKILEIRPRNSSCVVNFKDGTLQVIQLSDSSVLQQLSGHSSCIRHIKWQSSSSFLSMSKESLLYTWKNTGNGWAMKAILLDERLKLIKFDLSPNHHFLACGFNKGLVRVYKPESFVLLEELNKDINSELVLLKYSDIHCHLCLGFTSGYFCILSAQFDTICEMNHSCLELKPMWSIRELYKNSESFLFIALCDCENRLDIQVFASHKKSLDRIHTKKFFLKEKCLDLSFHSSGNYLLVACESCSILLYKIESNEIAGIIRLKSIPRCIDVDPSGLYISCGLDILGQGKVELYEIGTGKKLSEIPGFRKLASNGVKFSMDGSQLIVGSTSGTLYIWKCPLNISKNISKFLHIVKNNSDVWETYQICMPQEPIQKETRLRSCKRQVYARKNSKVQVPKLAIPKESECEEDVKENWFDKQVRYSNCEQDEQAIAIAKTKTNPVKYQTSDFYIKKPAKMNSFCQPTLKKSTFTLYSNTPTVDVESNHGTSKRSCSVNQHLLIRNKGRK